ncbi:MAG TPA: hypothetical protein VJH24_05955 [Candidatus Bilamarchaeaceae archaeon]|nr:hypothetical protein [Candidatus Bilamarchaeaceae archaeon]
MKAFVFTTDALLALTVALLVAMLTIVYVASPVIPRSLYLHQLSADVATVAEAQGAVADLIDGDDTALRTIFRSMPPSVCMQARLIDDMGNETIITEASCTTYQRELQSLWLPYHHNGENYLIRWEGWYR